MRCFAPPPIWRPPAEPGAEAEEVPEEERVEELEEEGEAGGAGACLEAEVRRKLCSTSNSR